MESKNKIMFFIIALSLLSVSGVSAITEDFIALAQNSTISACGCSIVENTIKIGNTGNINSLYSVEQDGKAAGWSVIRPKSFSLEDKKIKTLTNPVNIPCDAKKGKYSLKTYIETGFGLKKVINQDIVVEKCAEETNTNEEDIVEINQTIAIDETAEHNETSEEVEEQSSVIKVLKWVSYIAAGIIVIIVIIIIILYNSEAEERSLEEKKKPKKKAAEKKTVKKSVKKTTAKKVVKKKKR